MKNENLSLSPEKYETAGWKMKKLRIRCKCNMASANFAKKHSAVFDQTYIAAWYHPKVTENITYILGLFIKIVGRYFGRLYMY